MRPAQLLNVCLLSLATSFIVSFMWTSARAQVQTSGQTPVQKTEPKQVAPAAKPVQAPSLWFESGLGYRPSDEGLLPHLRIGFRGIQPLTDTAAIYAAFAVDGNLTLDMGGWYSFLPGPDDVFGFRSYAGTGLSFVAGSFGIALSAALSYELSPETSLILVYTHRPLLFPKLAQAFDVSLGVSFTAP